MTKIHPYPEVPQGATAHAPRLPSVLRTPHEISMFSITKVAQKVEKGVAYKVRRTFFSQATQKASLYIFREDGWTRTMCKRIVENAWFERSVLLLILGSCLTLAMYDPMKAADSSYNSTLNVVDKVFSVLFAVEMVLRVISQCFVFAPDAYLSNGWRRLDFLIVTVSFISFIPGANKAGMVRVIRVLRPLKAISNLSGARMMVTTLIESLPLMMDVGVLILWLVLVFSIVGMQQWLGKMSHRCFDSNHKIDSTQWDTPCVTSGHGHHCPADQVCLETGHDPNGGYVSFNNLAFAALAVFQVLTMANWTNLLYQLQASGPAWVALVWCFLLIAIGALFSLNLLVAVIGSKFSQENMLEKRRGYRGDQSSQDLLLQRTGSFHLLRRKLGKRMTRISRKVFSPLWWDFPLSDRVKKVVDHPRFDNAIMGVICLQTILLSLEYHGISSGERKVIEKISYVTSAIFIAEMMFKIWGLSLGGYFSVGQNCFDGFIVLLTLVELFLSSEKLKALQAFRLLRILRTVRIFRSYKNFRRLMDSILHGFVSLREFLLLLGICIFIFAVLGMQLFGGNASFTGQRTNFNTIWMSVLIMFEGLTATTYSNTMWLAMKGVGWPAALYFVAWMVVGNIGLLNLLLAIMIDHFNSDPTEGEGDRSLKRLGEQGEESGIFGMIAKRRQRIFAHEAERTAAWLRQVGEEYVPKKKLSFAGRFGSTISKLRGLSSFMRSKKSATSDNSATSSVAPSAATSMTSRSAKSTATRHTVVRSRNSLTRRNFMYAVANAADAKVAEKAKTGDEAEVSPWKTVATKMGVEKSKSAKPKSVTAILAAMQPSAKGGSFTTKRAWSQGKDASVSRRSNSVLMPGSLSLEQGARAHRLPSGLGPPQMNAVPSSSPQEIPRSRRTQSVADMSALREQLDIQNVVRDSPREAEDVTPGKEGLRRHLSLESEKSAGEGSPRDGGGAPGDANALEGPRAEGRPRAQGAPDAAADAFQGLATVAGPAAPPKGRSLWRLRSMRKREVRASEQEDIDEEDWRRLPGACMPSKRQLAPLLTWEMLPPPIPGDLVLPYEPPAPQEDELVLSKAELRRRAGIPTSIGTLISTALPTVGHQRLAGMAARPADKVSTPAARANARTKKKGEMKVKAAAIGKALQSLLANPMESAGCMRFRSLGFLPPTSRLRRALFLLIASKEYEWFSLIMVLASCISLAMDSPDLNDATRLKRGLWYSDIVFASFFSAECLVKIVIMGLYKHEGAFWESNWNKMDVFVTLSSLSACFVSPAHQGDQIKALRSFRLLRALRPLRMVSKLKNLRMVILTLIRSLPSCINVIALGLFFFIIYGILGVQLFAGTFYSCNDTFVRYGTDCVGNFTDPATGLPTPRVWANAPINFDNLWYAIVAIFVVVTLDDWPTLMYNAMDAVGVGVQPRLNNQIWASLYFIFLILMGGIFWANLLAGVVTDCYSKLPPEDKDMLFITESQKRWAQAIKMKRYENHESMQKVAPPTANVLRRAIWYIVKSKAFDYTVLALICGNIMLLAAQHKNEGPAFTRFTKYGNFAFTYSFCLELLLKLIALGPRKFWADGWNRFDLLVVAGSVMDLNIKSVNIGARVFRLGRLFKIIKSTRGLRTLVNAFVGALPAMFNVGLLFFIMIFIAAILTMDLFGGLPYGTGIFPENNFRNIGNSLLVCLKLFTGDNWTPIYFQTSCSGKSSDCFLHILVPVFVLFYTVIMRFMLLNLVLSVILDRFTDSATYEGLLSTDNFFDALQRKMLLDGFVRKLKMKIRASPNAQRLALSGRASPDAGLQNPVPAGLVAFAMSKAKQREQQKAANGWEIGRDSSGESMKD